MLAGTREAAREMGGMAFSRALVALKARGREETLNEHLVKLLALQASEATRLVWRKEVARHLRFLAALRIKPDGARIPARHWWTWLYTDPFEGNESGYVIALISHHVDDFVRNDLDARQIAKTIRRFHAKLCFRLEAGQPGEDLIPS